ncbi:uncharacterized [Tachysurus ichikawai]
MLLCNGPFAAIFSVLWTCPRLHNTITTELFEANNSKCFYIMPEMNNLRHRAFLIVSALIRALLPHFTVFSTFLTDIPKVQMVSCICTETTSNRACREIEALTLRDGVEETPRWQK